MPPDHPCTLRLLARGRSCRVECCCDHDQAQLTLGPLTLRLSPQQLEDLAGTLAAAVEQLGRRPAERPAHRMLC